MTDEFKMLMNDPDFEKSPGPHGTLVFRDGEQFCVIVPSPGRATGRNRER